MLCTTAFNTSNTIRKKDWCQPNATPAVWLLIRVIMVQVFTIPFPPICDLCRFSQISPFADWIHYRRGWNLRVIDLTISKSFL